MASERCERCGNRTRVLNTVYTAPDEPAKLCTLCVLVLRSAGPPEAPTIDKGAPGSDGKPPWWWAEFVGD